MSSIDSDKSYTPLAPTPDIAFTQGPASTDTGGGINGATGQTELPPLADQEARMLISDATRIMNVMKSIKDLLPAELQQDVDIVMQEIIRFLDSALDNLSTAEIKANTDRQQADLDNVQREQDAIKKQQEDAERKAKRGGLFGKIFGWVVASLAFVVSGLTTVATGGAAWPMLALATYMLADQATQEATGKSILSHCGINNSAAQMGIMIGMSVIAVAASVKFASSMAVKEMSTMMVRVSIFAETFVALARSGHMAGSAIMHNDAVGADAKAKEMNADLNENQAIMEVFSELIERAFQSALRMKDIVAALEDTLSELAEIAAELPRTMKLTT